MTVADVVGRVEELIQQYGSEGGAWRWADEFAHRAEDELYVAVLRAIAVGETDDPRGVAAAALETQGLDFSRWTA